MSKADVLFITCSALPDLDPDDQLVIKSLGHLGIKAAPAVWNDPAVNWGQADLCVIRSAWDYHLDRQAFLAWAKQVSAVTQLLNPLPVISWDSHKSYLQELAAAGLSVVPTTFFKNEATEAAQTLKKHSGEQRGADSVIKPAVGLASSGILKVNLNSGLDEALTHLQTLAPGCDMMVQPFIPSVIEYGEQDLVFIDGRYSHTVKKVKAFQSLQLAGAEGEIPSRPQSDELRLAQAAIEFVEAKFGKRGEPFPALYARVDTVRDADDKPLIIELELVEPSLFLAVHGAAPGAMTVAIQERLKAARK